MLFVHGSSMASQPTFDLTVPGRPDSSVMDWFARRGFDCWTVDMEGYGRSDKHARHQLRHRQRRRRPRRRHRLHRASARHRRSFLIYGISSGALRAALFAQRHPDRVSRLALDAFVWTGEGAPTLEQRRKKLPEFLAMKRRPIDRAFVHSIFTARPPGLRRARASSRLSPTRSWRSTTRCPTARTSTCARSCRSSIRRRSRCRRIMMRGQYDGIAAFDDLIEFFKRLPNPGQAVHGDGRHLARELPAEELPDGLSHPACLLHPARARLRLPRIDRRGECR